MILEGVTSGGAVVPVEVTDQGRLVAEGLAGPAGPAGPEGPAGPTGPAGSGAFDEIGDAAVFGPVSFDGTGSTPLVLDSSGRLLVGAWATSAGHRLVVQGDGEGVCLASTSSAPNDGALLSYLGFASNNHVAAASIIARRDGGTWTNGSSHPSRLVFSTTADGASSPTEQMRIASDGDILFNTTSTGGFNGISVTDGLLGARQLLWNRADTAGVSYPLGFLNADSSVGYISYSNTATTYSTSSDYRLKENVTAVTDGITRLQQLKPSRFNFIADPDKTVDGFLAHEVQTVVPEAITGEKDAVDENGKPQYQGIDQSKLVPLLTAALQEAIGEIESLRARVAALEAP